MNISNIGMADGYALIRHSADKQRESMMISKADAKEIGSLFNTHLVWQNEIDETLTGSDAFDNHRDGQRMQWLIKRRDQAWIELHDKFGITNPSNYHLHSDQHPKIMTHLANVNIRH